MILRTPDTRNPRDRQTTADFAAATGFAGDGGAVAAGGHFAILSWIVVVMVGYGYGYVQVPRKGLIHI